MQQQKTAWILVIAILTLSPHALAQSKPTQSTPPAAQSIPTQSAPSQSNQARPASNPFDSPVIRKYWNPIVGAGAVFEVTDAKGKKTTQEYEILSTQLVDGKKAYWFEFAMESPDFRGKLRGKSLIIPEVREARKMIIQFPEMAPMEMPVATQAQAPDTKDTSKLLGSETITVSGVSLVCEHRRDANGAETWVSSKVAPLKVVKGTVNGQTWELVRTLTKATDEISGTAKPFDPDAMKEFVAAQNKKN